MSILKLNIALVIFIYIYIKKKSKNYRLHSKPSLYVETLTFTGGTLYNTNGWYSDIIKMQKQKNEII